MNNRNFLQLVLNYIRLILLVISLSAVFTLILWSYGSPVIRLTDKTIVWLYEAYYKERLNIAEQLYEEDRRKGIETLELILQDIEPIKKDDRISGLKRYALASITGHYEETGQIERALYWCNKWVDFDKRDIDASIKKAQLLSLLPGHNEESLQVISSLHNRLPELQRVTELYLDMLIKQGKKSEALREYIDSFSSIAGLTLDRVKNEEWLIYFDTGDGMPEWPSLKVRPQSFGKSGVIFKFDLFDGTKSIRIEPPAYKRFIMYKPEILIHLSDDILRLDLLKLPLELQQIRQITNGLFVSDNDIPFLQWSHPEDLSGNNKTVSFQSEVLRYFPEAIVNLLEADKTHNLEKTIYSTADSDVNSRVVKLKSDIEEQGILFPGLYLTKNSYIRPVRGGNLKLTVYSGSGIISKMQGVLLKILRFIIL